MFEEKPIGKGAAVCMVLLAVVIDIFQFVTSFFIPVIADILSAGISLFAFLTFYTWFKIGYGISFTSPKRMLAMLAGTITEAVGIILPADLPGLTITVVITILLSKSPQITQLAQGNVMGSFRSRVENAVQEHEQMSTQVQSESRMPNSYANTNKNIEARAKDASQRLKAQQNRTDRIKSIQKLSENTR